MFKLLKFFFSPFLIPIFLFSCVAYNEPHEQLSSVAISHGPLDMIASGNRLPFDLDKIEIYKKVKISANEIRDIAFINTNLLVVKSEKNEIYIVDFVNDNVISVPNVFGENLNVSAPSLNRFLVCKVKEIPITKYINDLLLNHIYCLNEKGEILWDIENTELEDIINFESDFHYNVKYLALTRHGEIDYQLSTISREGTKKNGLGFHSQNVVRNLIPTQKGILLFRYPHEPLFAAFNKRSFDIRPFALSRATDSIFRPIITKDYRYVGDDAFGRSIIILDEKTDSRKILPFADMLKIKGDPFGELDLFAEADGIIYIKRSGKIIEYDGEGFKFLNIPGFSEDSDSIIMEFFTDLHAENFIIPQSEKILYGKEKFNEIPFNAEKCTFLNFSGNFEYCAFGTTDGNVVILKMTKQEEKAE